MAERGAARERLVKKSMTKKPSFAQLIRAAAIAEGYSQDLPSGSSSPFQSVTDGSGSLRRAAQENFIWMSVLASTGLLLAVSVNEILWYSAVGFETVDTVFTTILKIGVVVTTVVAFFFLYRYYDSQLAMMRAAGVGLSQGFWFLSMWEGGLLWWFLADLLTLIPMPFPFIHFTIEFNDIFHEDTPTVYTSDNLLMASMFLRVQFLPRLIAEIWCMHNSMAFVSAKMNNVVIDTWFVIRALFIANFGTLCFLIFMSVLASAYIMLIFERPYPHVDQLAEYDNALYYTIITMTTVGYGDIAPSTRLGRYMALLISIQGVVFLALVIQGVVARVELSTTESRIVEYVQTQKNTALTRERAAAVCQTVWRQYRENVRLHRAGRKAVMVRANPGVTACLRAFTNALREQDAADIEGLDSFTQMTHRGIDGLQDRFDEMEDTLKKISAALKIK